MAESAEGITNGLRAFKALGRIAGACRLRFVGGLDVDAIVERVEEIVCRAADLADEPHDLMPPSPGKGGLWKKAWDEGELEAGGRPTWILPILRSVGRLCGRA